MRSENHRHHHLHPHHLYHIHHRSTFLPLLCSRPSIKDVSLPRWRDRPGSTSDDPLSPRIGCMGQVKRNNKIAGFPTSHNRPSSTSPVVKYSKLKKLFSGKNLSTATTASTAPTTVPSCGSRQRVTLNIADVPKNKWCNRNENFVSISIENMDPPLPVIKRVQKTQEGNEVDSLWKRRSGGPALKSLQLQQIHHPRHSLLQPTSV